MSPIRINSQQARHSRVAVVCMDVLHKTLRLLELFSEEQHAVDGPASLYSNCLRFDDDTPLHHSSPTLLQVDLITNGVLEKS